MTDLTHPKLCQWTLLNVPPPTVHMENSCIGTGSVEVKHLAVEKVQCPTQAVGAPGWHGRAATHGKLGDRIPTMPTVTPFSSLALGDPCLDVQYVTGLAESFYWK